MLYVIVFEFFIIWFDFLCVLFVICFNFDIWLWEDKNGVLYNKR